jgi:hypothetical protein
MISFSVHKLSVYGLVHKDSKTAACQFWVLLQNKRQNFPNFLIPKSGMNRINRKLCSQDSLVFAAISLTLLIITTRNKDYFSSYFKHKHCSFSNK